MLDFFARLRAGLLDLAGVLFLLAGERLFLALFFCFGFGCDLVLRLPHCSRKNFLLVRTNPSEGSAFDTLTLADLLRVAFRVVDAGEPLFFLAEALLERFAERPRDALFAGVRLRPRFV